MPRPIPSHARGRLARAAIAMALLYGLGGATHLTPAHALPVGSGDAGTVTVVSNGTPTDLDPASNQDDASNMVQRNIQDPLVRVAGVSMESYTPALATSWDTNADKSVWTFHLRHGVRFHTGRCCMTATDVQYSIARTVTAQLAASGVFGRFLSDPFKQIQVIDPYTVRFNLGRSQPIFLGAISDDYTAMILDSHALKAHEVKKDWGHAWASEHDLGTGPYVIQQWTHGQQVILVRYPQYWGGWGGRHFSKVVLPTVPDRTTRRALIERGQADIAFDLTPSDYDALKQNPQVTVHVGSGPEVTYFVMTEAGPLASPYARQALSYAFNYDALIKGVYRGYARRAYGPLASTLLGYDPHVFAYHTDLAKARALLQKAGVPAGTTLTLAYYDPYGVGAEILQAQLAQIGITLKIEQLTQNSFNSIFYGNAPPGKRPNLLGDGWWPDYNDPYDESFPLIDSASQGPNGSNGGYYHNAAVDRLLAEMKNAGRDVLIRDAHTLQDITGRLDPPAIWTAEPAQVTVYRKGLQGLILNPLELRTYSFYPMYR